MERRIVRRVKRLSSTVSASIEPATRDAIEALAERAELPMAEIVRLAIERGLPGVKSALKSSSRSDA